MKPSKCRDNMNSLAASIADRIAFPAYRTAAAISIAREFTDDSGGSGRQGPASPMLATYIQMGFACVLASKKVTPVPGGPSRLPRRRIAEDAVPDADDFALSLA